MDEVLIANFMTFQDAVTEIDYDLVIADGPGTSTTIGTHPGAENARNSPGSPDFVGYLPMPAGGAAKPC